MRAMTGDEIRQATRGRWLARSQPLPARGVSIDSRTASPGDWFVAIVGDQFDGHAYLEAAAEKGCVGAIIALGTSLTADQLAQFPAGVLGVADTREALVDLASYYRSVLPANVIGVTGSNGKTTVKRMIHHILAKRLIGTASPKSFNNDIGVPLTLLGAGGGDDYVVCEIGTNHLGEISKLARIAKPDIAVITSISAAHLEGLGSIEQIAAEKAAILSWLADKGVGIVTADSEELQLSLPAYGSGRTILTFGESAGAQLRLTDYQRQGWSQRFEINERQWVTLPSPGRHNALNAMAAMAVAARFGFSQEDAAEALADFPGVDMRCEPIDLGAVTVVNDAYNANPASLLAAADILAESAATRRVLVVGDMGELGAASDAIHAELGDALARRGLTLLVTVGPQAGILAGKAGEAGANVVSFADVDTAAAAVGEWLCAGDVVLLKASRAIQLERLLPALREAANGMT